MNLPQKIFTASLEAIRPNEMVMKALHRRGNTLMINDRSFELKKNVNVVGFGKAVYGMAIGLNAVLNDHIREGILSVPHGTCTRYNNQLDAKFTVMEGARDNLPDDDAFATAMEIKKIAKALAKDDILVILVSGGGSALLPAPIDGMTLAEKLQTIKAVVNAGGSINQLNTIRKNLSQLKGGKLALLSPSQNIISLIISDIVNDPLDLIASGPTVFDTSYGMDCLAIFEQLNLKNKVPSAVIRLLGQSHKNLEDDSRMKMEEKCVNAIIGSNIMVLNEAAKVATSDGFQSIILTNKVVGDASHIGHCMATLALDILTKSDIDINLLRDLNIAMPAVGELSKLLENNTTKRLCLLFGGETTVVVKGNGKGGRNMHLVLSALKHLIENRGTMALPGRMMLLSGSTDGQDGPTDSAGAWLDNELIENIHDVRAVNNFLDNCGSYDFFTSDDFRSKYLLKTGLTGTNVMDVQILLIER